MAEIRIYTLLRAQTAAVPTDNQWNTVLSRAGQDGALTRAIRLAARRAENRISYGKRNRGTNAGRLTLVSFEMASEDVDDLLFVSNTQAALRGITGTTEQKIFGVLIREIREAAVASGFSQAQANLLDIPAWHYAPRMQAIAAVQQYLANNAAVWYAANIRGGG